MITALVRVGIALHPVTGGCGGHSCHSHDPPGFFVLVCVAATTQICFRGLTVRGAHRLELGVTDVSPRGQDRLPGPVLTGWTASNAGNPGSGSGCLAHELGLRQ